MTTQNCTSICFLREFVEIWNRWVDGALPREVIQPLEHTEEIALASPAQQELRQTVSAEATVRFFLKMGLLGDVPSL